MQIRITKQQLIATPENEHLHALADSLATRGVAMFNSSNSCIGMPHSRSLIQREFLLFNATPVSLIPFAPRKRPGVLFVTTSGSTISARTSMKFVTGNRGLPYAKHCNNTGVSIQVRDNAIFVNYMPSFLGEGVALTAFAKELNLAFRYIVPSYARLTALLKRVPQNSLAAQKAAARESRRNSIVVAQTTIAALTERITRYRKTITLNRSLTPIEKAKTFNRKTELNRAIEEGLLVSHTRVGNTRVLIFPARKLVLNATAYHRTEGDFKFDAGVYAFPKAKVTVTSPNIGVKISTTRGGNYPHPHASYYYPNRPCWAEGQSYPGCVHGAGDFVNMCAEDVVKFLWRTDPVNFCRYILGYLNSSLNPDEVPGSGNYHRLHYYGKLTKEAI